MNNSYFYNETSRRLQGAEIVLRNNFLSDAHRMRMAMDCINRAKASAKDERDLNHIADFCKRWKIA